MVARGFDPVGADSTVDGDPNNRVWLHGPGLQDVLSSIESSSGRFATEGGVHQVNRVYSESGDNMSWAEYSHSHC